MQTNGQIIVQKVFYCYTYHSTKYRACYL